MAALPRMSAVVAMDGPAGAGKSTVARRVAQALGFTLLDTGALYRTVALAALRRGIGFDDAVAVTALAEELVAREALVLEALPDAGMDVRLEGERVGDAIRTPAVSMGASTVSAIPGVRAALLDAQRTFAAHAGVVCEGRDIGTVVFPDATLKIFLTASTDERARRRHTELVAREGARAPTFEATRAEVEQRDAQDQSRAIAPLRQADDAVLVDTTGLDLDAVVAHCLELARARNLPRGQAGIG